MWALVRARRGVTIILTTHYIEEAEEMADRVGVINGRLLLVEDKAALMRKLGKRQLTLTLRRHWRFPPDLAEWSLTLAGRHLTYSFDAEAKTPACPPCCAASATWASPIAIWTPAAVRSKTSSSIWWRRQHERHQPSRHLGDISHRNGPRDPPSGKASPRPSSPRRSISSCSAARSARA
jgi:ABC-type sulfate/molybdate transport systems ATPase subunit